MLRRVERYLVYICFFRQGISRLRARPLRGGLLFCRQRQKSGVFARSSRKRHQKTRLKGFPLEKPDGKVCCCIRSEFALDMIGAVRLRKADKICSLGDAYGSLDKLSGCATRCPLRIKFIAPISAESTDGKSCIFTLLYVTKICFVTNPNI